VTLSPSVARARFASFIDRALKEARGRGMNDGDIHLATGISPSTFHRWQTTTGGLPQIPKVIQFCDGLGIPARAALAAMGAEEQRTSTEPAAVDPDVAAVLRQLADPNVSEEAKAGIRHTLRLLASAGRRTTR
jgi:hypothetical protein